jgi:transcriptional regulator with XRE-family HTH domain
MDYSKIIAIRIQRLCQKHGITINKLATLSGLKQSTIDNIIHGASQNPKIRTLHKIAITFNMTLSEFLDFPELNDYSPEEEDYE